MKLNGWKWDFPLDRYHSGKCGAGSWGAQGEETLRVKELALIAGRITAPLFLSLSMERGFWVRRGGNGWAACAVSHRGRVPARLLHAAARLAPRWLPQPWLICTATPRALSLAPTGVHQHPYKQLAQSSAPGGFGSHA